MPAVPLQSLWSVTAPAGPVCGRLEEALHAQVAVIGAGYTGLSAALHLAERGREGVVLEAADIGARIFTESPPLELTRSAHGWSIETPRGRVRAPLVIAATNAYTGPVCGPLRRTVIPVPSFQVATAPIPTALRREILPEGQAASDTRRLLRYFRVDGSGRLVLGSRGTFAQAPGVRSVQRHYRAVHEIYPQLEGLPFEYHWGGLVAMTPDHLPHLHELAPGLLAGLGYNGRGVAMATMMGRLLARLALGVPAAELGFPVTAMRPVPLHALSGIAVRAAIQYLRLADAVERARRSP